MLRSRWPFLSLLRRVMVIRVSDPELPVEVNVGSDEAPVVEIVVEG